MVRGNPEKVRGEESGQQPSSPFADGCRWEKRAGRRRRMRKEEIHGCVVVAAVVEVEDGM